MTKPTRLTTYVPGRWSVRAGHDLVLDVDVRGGLVTAVGPDGELADLAALPGNGSSRDMDTATTTKMLAALLPGLLETARATWPHLVKAPG